MNVQEFELLVKVITIKFILTAFITLPSKWCSKHAMRVVIFVEGSAAAIYDLTGNNPYILKQSRQNSTLNCCLHRYSVWLSKDKAAVSYTNTCHSLTVPSLPQSKSQV